MSMSQAPPLPTTARPALPPSSAAAEDKDAKVPWEAINRCLSGDSLLKFGRAGEPHFRMFRLSPDFSCVRWTSKGKENSVSLDDVRRAARDSGGGFLDGKKTALFKRNMKKRYNDRLCFSLDYASKTLDLVCSDLNQKNAWKDALKYILKNGPPPAASRFAGGGGAGSGGNKPLGRSSVRDGGNGGVVSAADRARTSSSGGSLVGGEGGNVEDGKEGDEERSTQVMSINDVYTWGFGGQGQLGHSGAYVHKDSSTPVMLRALLDMNVLDIDCGLEHTIAVVKPGKLMAWGHGGGGRLGTAGTDGTFSGVLGTSSGVPVREITPAPVALTGDTKRTTLFKAVACGDYHSLGLTTEGKVFSWGVGFVGQLGVGADEDEGASTPTPTSASASLPAAATAATPVPIVVGRGVDDSVAAIAASYTTSACVTGDGELYTWGGGSCGKLGHGPPEDEEDGGFFEDVPVPRRVLGGGLESRKVISVACGDFHTLAIVMGADARGGRSAGRSGQELFAWGDNSCGQLGTGDFEQRSTPTMITLQHGDGHSALYSIAAGSAHSAAIFELKMFGPVVHVWGAGNMGQLGLRRLMKKEARGSVVGGGGVGGGSGGAGSSGVPDGKGKNKGAQAQKGSTAESSDSKARSDGAGGEDYTNEEKAASTSFCVSIPTKLTIHPEVDARMRSESVGSSGRQGGNNFSARGPNLMPQMVTCGANHTAVLIADTTSMRDMGMGGKVFMFGESSSGQAGDASSAASSRRRIMRPQMVQFRDEMGVPIDKEVRNIRCGGRFTCALVARKWISDSETKICMSVKCKSNPTGAGGALFTTFLRRHHCRNCGGVYCALCTSQKMPILALGHIQPVRVCDECSLRLRDLY